MKFDRIRFPEKTLRNLYRLPKVLVAPIGRGVSRPGPSAAADGHESKKELKQTRHPESSVCTSDEYVRVLGGTVESRGTKYTGDNERDVLTDSS